ncbi:MarR family winged helix-turn-helix transcriptional regulator [Leptospira meyeri]|uniref:MarR family winged helix-turn-helix transcriptional regulator n=1 Tax=Leptospira meyeri TaxID=29508 RepID=UPI0002BEA091|nr:MarR family transcriptional regulator [Leptospira meyeri]EMJ90222.1 winged helix DNA-binding domain protein [Leptospira meyeri serovar Semaranga str. Veldrot Semarang 173]PKA23714.1 MarR family transcriptional regulator [Leptospira sp. mixed culture ATI2-C-A1]TGM22785.1 MarR family transcriptional regulator [Leptospira meyeri]
MFLLDDQIGFNLNRLALLFRRELIRSLKDFQLSPEQWQVLAMLWQKGTLSQKQIIELTLQDAPSASKMIRRMKQAGLIQIEVSKLDKRSTLISLSAKGKSLEKVLPKKILLHFDPILSAMPEKNRKTFLILLKQFRMVFGDEIKS